MVGRREMNSAFWKNRGIWGKIFVMVVILVKGQIDLLVLEVEIKMRIFICSYDILMGLWGHYSHYKVNIKVNVVKIFSFIIKSFDEISLKNTFLKIVEIFTLPQNKKIKFNNNKNTKNWTEKAHITITSLLWRGYWWRNALHKRYSYSYPYPKKCYPRITVY